MYAVVVTLEIYQEHWQKFLALMAENAKASLNTEEDCHQFDVCTDAALPNTVFLYELYSDRAAFDHHLGTTHFKKFDAAVVEMIIAKNVRTFSQVNAAQ